MARWHGIKTGRFVSNPGHGDADHADHADHAERAETTSEVASITGRSMRMDPELQTLGQHRALNFGIQMQAARFNTAALAFLLQDAGFDVLQGICLDEYVLVCKTAEEAAAMMERLQPKLQHGMGLTVAGDFASLERRTLSSFERMQQFAMLYGGSRKDNYGFDIESMVHPTSLRPQEQGLPGEDWWDRRTKQHAGTGQVSCLKRERARKKRRKKRAGQ